MEPAQRGFFCVPDRRHLRKIMRSTPGTAFGPAACNDQAVSKEVTMIQLLNPRVPYKPDVQQDQKHDEANPKDDEDSATQDGDQSIGKDFDESKPA